MFDRGVYILEEYQLLRVRKHMRLPGWDYSQEGAYFLTLCIRNRKPILSQIVGRGILDAPEIRLSRYGALVQETICFISAHNTDVMLHNWVIMPNHVHILLSVSPTEEGGASGMPRPTNGVIPKVVSSLKRFTNRRSGAEL